MEGILNCPDAATLISCPGERPPQRGSPPATPLVSVPPRVHGPAVGRVPGRSRSHGAPPGGARRVLRRGDGLAEGAARASPGGELWRAPRSAREDRAHCAASI